METKITIIGGGNLGQAIAWGIIKGNIIEPHNLTITRRNTEKLNALKKVGVIISEHNAKAIEGSSIVFLAVKPYKTQDILEEIKGSYNSERQILVSTVTGVSINTMQEILGKNAAVIRAMPNTAIAIGMSMTCLAAQNATEDQKIEIETIFDQLGESVYIDEELMGSATVLAASGIAFALRFIRAKMQAGIEIGFSSDLALKIAAQTVAGAAQLVLEQSSHPEAEIDKVTTPLGITISGLNTMEHHGFSSSLIQGILNSYNKISKI